MTRKRWNVIRIDMIRNNRIMSSLLVERHIVFVSTSITEVCTCKSSYIFKGNSLKRLLAYYDLDNQILLQIFDWTIFERIFHQNVCTCKTIPAFLHFKREFLKTLHACLLWMICTFFL
jgi:hypothetical protein